ncbi:hypothetical protein EVG20_g2874 [Dentipellis fragilis]|uniref:FAD-binding domain-containing protein n=1 Tax=Dentipellis fragilis TaxID=205917 RepID=A0A4Y9Z7M6_9AGAM|nr:hypothetical protein EVG20_g2874 [Dentipellis fragilis]
MPSLDVDVLVVGAGPTGLVAALTLAKNGIPVRVIERLPEHLVGQRGAGIMPRILEVYYFLGIQDDIKKLGYLTPYFQDWKDGKPTKTYPMTPILEPTPTYPERRTWILGQDAQCNILREHLRKYGVEVELATELRRLDQDEDHVTAVVANTQDGKETEMIITAKYLVGADGAKGVVRKLSGLHFLGETRDTLHILIAEMKASGIDPTYWHKFGEAPGDVCLLSPTHRSPTEHIYGLIIYGPNIDFNKALEDHDYVRQKVYGMAKIPELNIAEFESISDYRPSIRVATSFRKDRVFIAGDAAHVHSFTGGQGLNSGVMDSFNLGWKLALVCRGLATPDVLDSYNTERLPVIKEMLQRTTVLLNRTIASDNGRYVSVQPEDSESFWQRPTWLNQLGVHYRWSPLVVDEAVDELEAKDKGKAEELVASTYMVEEGRRLHAGDRAPDAPGLVDLKSGDTVSVLGSMARLQADLVRTVVIRSQDANPSDVATSGAELVLQDKEGHAYPVYPTRIAVVRPDGVVGALVSGAEGVEKYFAGVFTAALLHLKIIMYPLWAAMYEPIPIIQSLGSEPATTAPAFAELDSDVLYLRVLQPEHDNVDLRPSIVYAVLKHSVPYSHLHHALYLETDAACVSQQWYMMIAFDDTVGLLDPGLAATMDVAQFVVRQTRVSSIIDASGNGNNQGTKYTSWARLISMNSLIDVLVVGAGPTGLVAALTLAKNDVPVRVIEKLPKHPVGQRGANIMPRTLEVYHFLGVLGDVRKAGTFKSDLKEWKNGKPVKIHSGMTGLDPTPTFPEHCACLLGQDAACGILRGHLEVYGIEVELATELVRLEQDTNSVAAFVVKRKDGKEVEDAIRAKYVVGADGARAWNCHVGAVRKLLDLCFLGETRSTINMITGDAEVYGIDQEYIHKFDGMPNGIATLRPTNRSAKENIYFYSVFGPNFDHDRALEDHEYLRQFVYDIAKLPKLRIGKIETITNYRPNIRIASSFSKGRVFVAGDAAHVHSPTGGQGMNSSVMDAFNLGWKLALASKGLATPALLESYNTERLPVVKEMLERTTSLLNRTVALGDSHPAPAHPAGKKSESPWSRPQELSQLGVNYRWSPIVVEELNSKDKGKVEELPARAYVASGGLHAATGLRMHRDSPDHHTVLVFSDGEAASALGLGPVARPSAGLVRTVAIRLQSASPAETAADVDLVLQDKEGYAYLAYATRVAIIRPDGVVGALVDGAEGVEKYFAGVFA